LLEEQGQGQIEAAWDLAGAGVDEIGGAIFFWIKQVDVWHGSIARAKATGM
jgi:hypothetical protein